MSDNIPPNDYERITLNFQKVVNIYDPESERFHN